MKEMSKHILQSYLCINMWDVIWEILKRVIMFLMLVMGDA